jgi:hypothetical protein
MENISELELKVVKTECEIAPVAKIELTETDGDLLKVKCPFYENNRCILDKHHKEYCIYDLQFDRI